MFAHGDQQVTDSVCHLHGDPSAVGSQRCSGSSRRAGGQSSRAKDNRYPEGEEERRLCQALSGTVTQF